MALLELAIFLLAAVLISAVLEPFLPRVSLPLVQMLLGIVIYFFVDLPHSLSIDSGLFLVLFIAPLLFDESKSANNKLLWTNRSTILGLAIGLVIVLVLCIGFTLNLLVPSVPLAAAFALGAALGPTDSVAVASLSKDIKLNSRQKALLSGEALLNDASGVVSFQFAIAAAVTGAFSLAAAGKTFLVDFLGGIGLGLLIGYLAFLVMRQVRRIGVESATFHVCFELFLPFFVYLIAEHIHVSGILSVVAAGLLFSYLHRREARKGRNAQMFSTRLGIASENVWSLISFVLNGIIFIMLGTLLPSTAAPAIEESSSGIFSLILIVVAVTFVAEAVRFVWLLASDWLSANKTTGKRFETGKNTLRNTLVTTLSGPKGAVSLSIAMTIPTTLSSGAAFPQRDLLLFVTCGVIVLTLVLANFVVPAIAPDSDEETKRIQSEVEIEIYQNVIRNLKRVRTPENRKAYLAVTQAYHKRIARIKKSDASSRQLRFLQQEVLVQQEQYIEHCIRAENVDRRLGETYLRRIAKLKKNLYRKQRIGNRAVENAPSLNSTTTVMHKIEYKIRDDANVRRNRCNFKIGLERVAIAYLEQALESPDQDRADAAEALLSEHEPILTMLEARLRTLNREQGIVESAEHLPDQTVIVRSDTGSLRVSSSKKTREEKDDDFDIKYAQVQAEALRLELDEIQTQHEAGNLTAEDAHSLREEVYLLQMGLSD